ncbi:MAG TPA: PilZ domain-containing protein [Xanthobacteraceae bacterium]|nr:PilZ domain-containing protein [Xanthobacteraceae bacterium]
MTRELRRSPRRYIRQGARLVGADGASLGVCVMHDISGKGACLGFKTPAALPDNFILLLSHDGRLRRQCSVVWRSDDALGVEFIPDCPPQRS